MSVTGTFQVVGTVDAHDRGPTRYVAVSADGDCFAILTRPNGDWQFFAGPWSFKTMLRCADNVVAGDKRALTWPDAMLCLAAGYTAIHCEATRRIVERNNPDLMRELSPAEPPAAPPTSEHCKVAGCGE